MQLTYFNGLDQNLIEINDLPLYKEWSEELRQEATLYE